MDPRTGGRGGALHPMIGACAAPGPRSAGVPPWLDLPAAVWERVLALLPLAALRCCRLVCADWAALGRRAVAALRIEPDECGGITPATFPGASKMVLARWELAALEEEG